jgi:predicted acylesterase/phospholipase RssA
MSRLTRELLGDFTFLEAFEFTGRVLNISLTSTEDHRSHIVLNHENAPHVLIWSAVVASSALPGALAPAYLVEKSFDGSFKRWERYGKLWVDGSIHCDIPFEELRRSFSIECLIVSQVNPHIVPFLMNSNKNVSFLNAVQYFLMLEFLKWMEFLGKLDLWPRVHRSRMNNVFLQRFSGNMTLTIKNIPDLIWMYSKILSDPDAEALQRYISIGESMFDTMFRKVRSRDTLASSSMILNQQCSFNDNSISKVLKNT